MELNALSGSVFDIQGFSVHDGPGCRTLIFLKGCSMNCHWCSNPEGILINPVLLFNESKCNQCGNCVQACHFSAINIDHGIPVINRTNCQSCKEHPCLDTCYPGALKICGSTYIVDELVRIIQRDRGYWGVSGGVTLGGGEPLLQIDFAESLLVKFYNSFIHTAIETCGNVPWANFERVIPYLDWVFFDLKHMNPDIHQQATGVDNSQILKNARKLAGSFSGRLVFRMPLIPGFNDTESNIYATAQFLREIKRNEINILPLHHLGRQKYESLGLQYHAISFSIPTPSQLITVKNLFEELGIVCYAGHETMF